MSAAIPIVIRLLGLFGVKLSPFAAGAALAGGLIVLIGGSAAYLSARLYNAGYEAADAKCEAAALRAQLAAKDRDIEVSNKVARESDAARAELTRQSEQDQERIADYEERLRRRAANAACILVPDDFRGGSSSRVPNDKRSRPGS